MRVIALAIFMATGAHLQLKGINMSVIGKMNVQSEKTFDTGQKITLGVVCENAFMAHYHPENENVVFTRYSPSGQPSFTSILHLNGRRRPSSTMAKLGKSRASATSSTCAKRSVPQWPKRTSSLHCAVSAALSMEAT
jgi:hypothetical protein